MKNDICMVINNHHYNGYFISTARWSIKNCSGGGALCIPLRSHWEPSTTCKTAFWKVMAIWSLASWQISSRKSDVKLT